MGRSAASFSQRFTHPVFVIRLVGEREAHVEALEMEVQRLSETHIDSEKLLENIHSEKTALSRAIAQNRELKTQLAELQNGFVKMVSGYK